eukprot:57476-Chlamydomonas_euryale.AAC.1
MGARRGRRDASSGCPRAAPVASSHLHPPCHARLPTLNRPHHAQCPRRLARHTAGPSNGRHVEHEWSSC